MSTTTVTMELIKKLENKSRVPCLFAQQLSIDFRFENLVLNIFNFNINLISVRLYFDSTLEINYLSNSIVTYDENVILALLE